MKELIKDGLILLSTAQECMADVADKMAQWDNSQLIMEDSAFTSMNVSDVVINMSKEGSLLVDRLLECCTLMVENPTIIEKQKVTSVLHEIINLFQKISKAAEKVNEISHKIEGEAAIQREIEENIKKSLSYVTEGIDKAVAGADLLLSGDC